MSEVKTPWKDYMGDVPMHLDYFQGSMFEAVERMAELYPNNIAFDFMGKSTTYKKMVQEIEKCAKSLKTLGVRPGDKVTIAMPNCPQAIYMFYAVNLVGGIANMIHPLSAEKEIEFYLNASESTTAITLDQFYDKFEHIRQNTGIINIIIASVKDALSRTIRAGYMLTEGRKTQKIPEDAPVIRWKEFMDMSRYCFYKNYRVERGYNDPAVILYSGGTTGTTKGIVLTNGNFNALGQQIIATNPMFRPGDRMLAAMPLFHGFGLGVCVHSMLSQGGRCILIPRFTAKSYAKQIVKYKCNFIAGVPTLYEALLRLPSMDGADLSSLKGVFSGGDSLSIELKKKFDKFLYDHHAVIQVREGYGTTETVTACCLTPTNIYKEGSIGLPFPDTYIKIVEPDTDKEVPYGTEGEILLDGHDLRDYEPAALYHLFGIIFQDFGKYAVSAADNIRFGDLSAKESPEKIREAARKSGADAFISRLPGGYDTQLMRYFDRDGIELSGGQWQKLAIARAFYSHADILILDEPTAALDALAEQEVFRQFDELRGDRTTIFVSHRLSSATLATKIAVLSDGMLAEEGTHRELMEKNGTYALLFRTQASRYLDEENRETARNTTRPATEMSPDEEAESPI